MQPQTTSRSARALVSPTLIGGEIPLIDVADYLAGKPGAAQRAANQLRFAFEHVGFYYLAGHRVPQSLIYTAYREAARFHAQPIEATPAVKVDEHYIGYMPIARSPPPNAAAQGKKPSQNEAYFLRRERGPNDPDVLANRRFHAMNKWPSEGDLPGFRANMLGYMTTLEALCQKLVRLYALALFLPETFFDACFAEPHMILLPDGRWMDAPGLSDAFVVNGGDILHRWTNERFLSTPHRVRNVSGQLRYAVPFFCDPNHDTIIECLPTCQSAE